METMKKYIIRLASIVLCMFLFSYTGCDQIENSREVIEFTNTCSKDIIITFSNNYPDTIPCFEESDYKEMGNYKYRYVASNSTNDSVLYNLVASIDCLHKLYTDTISYYIIDEKVYKENGFFKVQLYYMVLQRYDLSEADMKYLDYKLTYPPSPKMRGMKMYPSYEEAVK